MKKYNGFCSDLSSLIGEGKAPSGATAPRPLSKEGLYALDVDGPIWDDTGLDDRTCEEGVPLWLGDDSVRQGITAMLTIDRCDEEMERLHRECVHLQQWAAHRCEILEAACKNTGASHSSRLSYGLTFSFQMMRTLDTN